MTNMSDLLNEVALNAARARAAHNPAVDEAGDSRVAAELGRQRPGRYATGRWVGLLGAVVLAWTGALTAAHLWAASNSVIVAASKITVQAYPG